MKLTDYIYKLHIYFIKNKNLYLFSEDILVPKPFYSIFASLENSRN